MNMLSDVKSRTPRTLAALTLASASAAFSFSPIALAQVAGTDKGLSVQTAQSSSVEQAKNLRDEGRLIESRATLERLIDSGAISSLPDAERVQAMGVLKSVIGKIQTADPIEMSVQKAELAVIEGDLLSAERQAQAVLGKSGGEIAQRERATAVVESVQTRRAEIAPLVPSMIQQARKDFQSKDYAAAKAGVLSVLKSGVEVSPELAKELQGYQLELVQLEQAGHSMSLSNSASMGMMQPGQIRRTSHEIAQASRPEPLPNDVAPTPASQPAPASQPSQSPNAQPIQIPATQTQQAPPAIVQSGPSTPAVNSGTTSTDDIVTQAMKAEAARLVAEADQAFDSARYGVAQDRYTLALAQFRQYFSATEISRVEGRIAETRVRLQTSGAGGIAQEVIASQGIVRSKAMAEFENFLTQADQRLSEGAPDRAQDLLAEARFSVTRARSAFNETEMNAFNNRLDELSARIEARRTEMATTEAAKREADLKKKAADAEANRLSERDRKVSESIDRIRALQQERKYEEALQVTEQTLFLDPNNPTALLLRDALRNIIIYTKYDALTEERGYRSALQRIDSAEAILGPKDLMDFPSDWPGKTYQRGESSAFAEPAENRRVLAKLNSVKQPVDLAESRFEDVLKFIAATTQINVDADWESLAAVGVEKDTPVTLKLSPVTVKAALDRILTKVSRDQFARAGWAVNDGVISVASEEALRKNRTLVIYNIQDLLFEIQDYRDVPQIDLNNVLQQSSSGGGGGGQSPFTNVNNNQNQAPDRQQRLRAIIDIIYQNVDFEGWKENGGETGAMQELNGSLIITNTPKNHREIIGLLSKIREIRNMQINVETKFLLVNQDWFEQIGFDLDIIWNANSSQVKTAQSQNPNVLPSDFFNFSPAAARPLGLNRQLSNIPLGPGGTVANPTGGRPENFSPIATQQNSLGLTNTLAEGDFATAVLGAAPALGIAGQFLDDIQVDFLIQATQADKRTVRLTAPRLTFTNGQTANIYVVTQQAFVSGLNPIVGDSAVGFNPQVSVLSEGVTMLVEGVISSDRRYVTMSIDAGVARLDQFRQSATSAVAGGQLVNSANTQAFIQLPQITVTRVRTTVTVPDEGTVLLGGQRLITEVEVETGVPVLSKIPIINRFFTNRLESKEEQTLLILVKPTVMIQTEEEEKNFPGLLDSVRSGLGIGGR
jgi:general secretion pathway protein D